MNNSPKPRIAKISSQLQVRIPRDLFEQYGFGAEAEVVATETGIEFRPIKSENEKFAELLEQLVSEGFTGEELVGRFRKVALSSNLSTEYDADEYPLNTSIANGS